MSDHCLTLSDYCIVNPPRWLPEAITASDMVSFIPMQDVSETGEWTLRQTKKLSEVQSGFTNFKSKDVLIAKITPCFENGKGALVDNLTGDVGFGSTEFHVLRAKDKTEPRFLFHLSQWEHFRVAALQFMSGSAGQQRVATEFFYKYRVAKLTENEQSVISDILDGLGTQIRETESIIAKLQQVKQGLLHDLLTRGVDENGELRPSYDDAPELYQSSELGWIPNDWEVLKLDDIALKIVDGTHHTPTYTKRGIPFLRVTDIHQKEINLAKIKYVSDKEHKELIQRCNPEPGDILYSKNGTIGLVKLVDWNWQFSVFVSLCLIKPDHSKVFNKYLEAILSSEVVWAQIRLRSKQGTVTNLHLEEIREFLIPCPPANEQQNIYKAHSEIQKKLDFEKTTLDKLKLKKSGLMDDLLTGKKRVTDLLPQQAN